MRRAPIVIGATIAGLAGVLGYHTAAPQSVLSAGALGAKGGVAAVGSGSSPKSGSSSGTGTGSTSTGSTGTGSTGTGSTGTGSTGTGSTGTGSTGTGSPPASGSSGSPSSSAPASSGTRTATGQTVNYFYGTLSVQVTATGKKITKVQIASLNDGGNFRSQSIDQYSIPLLVQEAMQAQSANVQGVSGATYTSQGFIQSLQSALSQLGI